MVNIKHKLMKNSNNKQCLEVHVYGARLKGNKLKLDF